MSSPGPLGSRPTQILLAAAIAAAAIGFFVGIDDGVPRSEIENAFEPQPSSRQSEEGEDASAAVTYEQLGALGPAALGGNRYTVADLGVPEVDLSKEVAIDASAKPATLADRALRRAYDGAPPTIPHDVDQMTAGSCVACHATALRVGENSAPLIPHAYYANCQQCHVVESSLFDSRPLATSRFVGLPAPKEGARAWKGAPPTIPHATWMRENCRACHGPTGSLGLRTSHPGRANCLQCHARSASMDPYEPTIAALLYKPPAALLQAVGPPRTEESHSNDIGDGATGTSQ